MVKTGENKLCLVCNTSFYVPGWRLKRGNTKYCSRICSDKSKIGRIVWNKGLKLPQFSGENHPNWEGGKTILSDQVRNSKEYKLWRITIFERDDYTCQICGTKGGILQVDHWPKTFAQILRESNIRSLEDAINCATLWDINNNRTLCLDCHKQTDTYLWKSLTKGVNKKWV
mgnify:CR=1 FL=1